MDELERLDSLRQREKELMGIWENVRTRTTEKLYEILNKINIGNKPIYYNPEALVNIEKGDYRDEEVVWQVRDCIEFLNDEARRDFGSSFDITISNKRITVNHASCGTWGSSDKCQLSRINLLQSIFLHEQDIIDELNEVVDVSSCAERWKVQHEIDQINQDILEAKRQRQREEILKNIKVGKYLASRCHKWVYPKREDGSEDWTQVGTKLYYFVIEEQIDKVCEATVKTHEFKYNWYTHQRKIKDLINQVIWGHIYILDNEDDPCPQEDK